MNNKVYILLGAFLLCYPAIRLLGNTPQSQSNPTPSVMEIYENASDEQLEKLGFDMQEIRNIRSRKATEDMELNLPNFQGTTELNDGLTGEYQRSAISYIIWNHQYNKSVFTYQLITSGIIFGMVMGIVSIGCWACIHHVRKGDPSDVHEIEISKEKIVLKSSVVGLFILFVSLAFFYIYLKQVYPITFVDSQNTNQQIKTSN